MRLPVTPPLMWIVFRRPLSSLLTNYGLRCVSLVGLLKPGCLSLSTCVNGYLECGNCWIRG